MPCRDCLHYLPSSEAIQRAVLDGYGYCKVAPTPELRARFFAADGACWLVPNRYLERRQ